MEKANLVRRLQMKRRKSNSSWMNNSFGRGSNWKGGQENDRKKKDWRINHSSSHYSTVNCFIIVYQSQPFDDKTVGRCEGMRYKLTPRPSPSARPSQAGPGMVFAVSFTTDCDLAKIEYKTMAYASKRGKLWKSNSDWE